MGEHQPPLCADLLVRLHDGDHHIARWNYRDSGIYEVPQTFWDGVDTHSSFHQDGTRREKITRGQLVLYPGGQTIGTAQPKIRPKQEIILWNSRAQPWTNLRGVELLNPSANSAFVAVLPLAESYPAVQLSALSDSEKIIVDPQALHGDAVCITTWLVEPNGERALGEAIKDVQAKATWSFSVPDLDLLHIFKSRVPWFAVAILSRSLSSCPTADQFHRMLTCSD